MYLVKFIEMLRIFSNIKYQNIFFSNDNTMKIIWIFSSSAYCEPKANYFISTLIMFAFFSIVAENFVSQLCFCLLSMCKSLYAHSKSEVYYVMTTDCADIFLVIFWVWPTLKMQINIILCVCLILFSLSWWSL